jgi:hypothetical protein
MKVGGEAGRVSRQHAHWAGTAVHSPPFQKSNYMIAVLYAYAIIAGPILLAAAASWVIFTWAEES